MNLHLGTAGPTDIPFLREMLYLAIWVTPGQPRPDRSILDEPGIAHYVTHFGTGRGDLGFIAEVDGEPVGACWSRILAGEPKGYGYIDDDTPELSIALKEEWRGKGIGTRLLETLLAELDQTWPQLGISVDPDNPAKRLYEKVGFVKLGEVLTSDTMVRVRGD